MGRGLRLNSSEWHESAIQDTNVRTGRRDGCRGYCYCNHRRDHGRSRCGHGRDQHPHRGPKRNGGRVSAIATKTATEVAWKRLVGHRAGRPPPRAVSPPQGRRPRAGVLRRKKNEGTGCARLEICVMNSVRLTTVTLIPADLRACQPERPRLDDGAVGSVSGGRQRPDRGWPPRSLGRRPGREAASIRGAGYSPCPLWDEVGPASCQSRLR